VLGGNGSGKSTLLQVISGFVTPNEGTVIHKFSGKAIAPEKLKEHISFASPYLQLIEDFTMQELMQHVSKFKPFRNNLGAHDIIEITGLSHAKNKLIRQFSSGMKQRLKLALAILADTSVLLLDEPVSNLDREAIEWYKKMIAGYSAGRTIMVCSNAIAEEYAFCNASINVTEFKIRKQRGVSAFDSD
jgi:ABC-type multidrug transport system ATPase subunit